ncbi:MAG TPA: hypothetical protein PK419_03070 [Spirochaetota bacterium]|jgi:hypothetical protein|nr:hypothetical protein [Spirochaetota bacterium]HOH36621.1 hypothetical protein [Spirochaetota bacterium]HPJ14736.1 hypothetical protein [Spirochaetota bacterium]HPY02283.1 hypothetical protein [Spirochaetota bacterium]HQA51815.1 hypothetical protein [Spirochaetota bacterium]
MKYKYLLSAFICFLCSTAIFSAKENILETGREVILTGKIRRGIYLSRDSSSDKEYMNTSYNLFIEVPVNVNDISKDGKIYDNINHFEIINFYEFDFKTTDEQKITVRGKLGVFSPREGYSRQYSTPVYLRITEIISYK